MAHPMCCPKCGFQLAPAAACARCGVVFDRIHAAPPRRPPPPTRVPGTVRKPWSPWHWVSAAAVLLAVGLWMQTNRARDTPPPGASLPVADPPESEPLAVMSTPLPVELEAEPLSVESPATAETPPVTARCPLADALRPSGVRQVPSYWMTGASGYEDAERRRQTTAAPMVVYFFTDWCGYCKRIDRELFSSSDVDRYLSRAVFRVRVNPEENASNRSLADRFGVHSYPAFFVVPAGGGEPSRCSLYAKEDSDPISAGELERRIEERNERHARQLLREGFELRQAGDVGAAIAVLDRAVQAAPMEPEGWLQRAVPWPTTASSPLSVPTAPCTTAPYAFSCRRSASTRSSPVPPTGCSVSRAACGPSVSVHGPTVREATSCASAKTRRAPARSGMVAPAPSRTAGVRPRSDGLLQGAENVLGACWLRHLHTASACPPFGQLL